jgi:HD-GYP domain-containing protein (c-di-GMP phosphodiesterase class II)
VSFAEDAPPPSKEQVRDLLLRMLREMQPEFVEHIPALAEHARATALQLGLSGEAVEEVVYGTQLHDIGMLAIPESMLAKPSALDPEEWALIHRHTVIGERIPIGARIVAVCDAFAAMTSPRAYRPTIPTPVALAELARCAGKQFDPAVVDAFITTLAT